MIDLKAALDLALRHSAAQQRRYRLDDPHERLVLEAARAFRAMLDDDRLVPELAALLRDIQQHPIGPPPPVPPEPG
jgi:hypothetical protein